MEHTRDYGFKSGSTGFDYVTYADGETRIPLPAEFTGTVDLQFTGDIFGSTSMNLAAGVTEDQELARVRGQGDELGLYLSLGEGFDGTVKVSLDGTCAGERQGMGCGGRRSMVPRGLTPDGQIYIN